MSPQTFTEFDARHRSALLRFAMVLTGDFHQAQDIVADVLGRAFEQWPRIAMMQYPLAYVRRMVINEHLSWRRRLSRTATSSISDSKADTAPDVFDVVDNREVLINLLTRLTSRQRTTVVMRYYLDQSVSTIAHELGCGEATVRSHLSHAMRTLRIDDPAGAVPAHFADGNNTP